MRPDSVGVAPRASWKYCARNTLVANIATPTEIDAITASVNVRFVKRLIGTMGSSTRNSVMTKPTIAAAEMPTSTKLVMEFHSNWLPPIETQISSSDTPTARSTAPT